MNDRWIYVKTTNIVCAVSIDQSGVIIGVCPVFKWSLGHHYQDLKDWLEKKGILKGWTDMGKTKPLSKEEKAKQEYWKEIMPDLRDFFDPKDLMEIR